MRSVLPWIGGLVVAAVAGCSGAFGIAGEGEQPTDAAPPPAPEAGSSRDATPDAIAAQDAGADADATVDAGPRDRWVFLSTETTTGRISSGGRVGPSGADALCTREGLGLGAMLTFKALVNTDAERPWDRVAPQGSLPRAYAMPTPAGPVRVFAAPRTNPLVPIVRHANGQEVGGLAILLAKAWTGVDAPANCSNWSLASASASSSFGDAASLTNWLRSGESSCTEARHLYCFEVD